MKEKVIEKLNAQFCSSIKSTNEYRGELTIVVKKDDIVRICQFLRDDEELRFDSLRDLCGADYHRPDERFEVIYNLY